MPVQKHIPAMRNLASVWGVILMTISIASLIALFSVILYLRAKVVMEDQVKQRLMNLAAVASQQFDGKNLLKIPMDGNRTGDIYRKTVSELYGIKQAVPEVHYAYILTRSKDPNSLVFIADGDAALSPRELDANGNGVVDLDEEPSFPSDPYPISEAPAMKEGFLRPATDDHVLYDQWGGSISGYAPIRRSDNGDIVAIIGLDMRASDFAVNSKMVLPPLVFFLILLSIVLIASYIVYHFLHRRIEEWVQLDRERAGLMLLTYHQLGGPLTIFKWSVESLETRGKDESLEEALKEHLAGMNEGITRMDRILADLHQAAIVQEGHVEVIPKSIRVDDLLRECVDELQANADHKGITLTLDVDQNVQCTVDPKILLHVTYQLLSNALAYTPRKGHVEVSAHARHGKLTVTVKDNGSGIPNMDKARMFEKFARGTNAARLQPDGNGLGLFIAKGLVEAAGGTISLSSTEGKGTTISFWMPLS